jgi:hypothetical protein
MNLETAVSTAHQTAKPQPAAKVPGFGGTVVVGKNDPIELNEISTRMMRV